MNHSISTVRLPDKPMSLSSIMAAPIYPLSPPNSVQSVQSVQSVPSAPSIHSIHSVHYSLHKDQRSPFSSFSSFQSPPTPPEDRRVESSSPPSSPHSFSSGSSVSLPYMLHRNSVSSIVTDGTNTPVLTLQERRLRNKTASAKYRQKKNQQQNEMRQMIGCLSEQNAVLERQLQELRLENEKLKATTDRLRGKMVAKKMLKQWMGRHKDQPQPIHARPTTISSTTSHSFYPQLYKKQQPKTQKSYATLSDNESHTLAYAKHSDDEDMLSLVDSDQEELESLGSE
ncbi:hypothetical protein BDF14DRAFT_1740428 [Spinellus fusiger]|nr:hypothetical protein BDF14DRAFT_1740428 [Spinellus fusiger]